MKKVLFLLIAANIVFGQAIFAQETESKTGTKKESKKEVKAKIQYEDPFLNEIYVEYGTPGIIWGGAIPVGIGLTSAIGSVFVTGTIAGLATALGVPSQAEVTISGFQSYGVAALTYQRHLKNVQWLGLGCDLAYSYCRIYGSSADKTAYIPSHIIMPMFNINFYYFRREHVELYSGLTTGLAFWFEKGSNNTVLFAGHINAFGVSAGGKHLRYHCEIGAGVKGSINMGIGYKF